MLSREATFVSVIFATMLLAAPALSQVKAEMSKSVNASKTPGKPERNGLRDAGEKAIDIGAQPSHNFDVNQRKIPAILQSPYDAPYSLMTSDTCAALEACD